MTVLDLTWTKAASLFFLTFFSEDAATLGGDGQQAALRVQADLDRGLKDGVHSTPSFFFNGAALRELPPLTLVFLRVVLGATILLPLLRMQGIGFPKGAAGWKPFVAIGLLNNVISFSLIVIGQTFIPSGLASILNATTPLFTVMVMAAAGEEALQARRVAG